MTTAHRSANAWMPSLQLVGARLKRASPWTKAAASFWVVFVVFPALMMTIRPSSNPHDMVRLFRELYGPEVAGYLGFAPAPLGALVMSTLALGPLSMLLLVLGGAKPKRKLAAFLRDAGEKYLVWLGLHFGGLTLVTIAIFVVGGDFNGAWSWIWRLGLGLALSSGSSLGVGKLIVAGLQSKGRALVGGVFVFAALGLWGRFDARGGANLSPHAIDMMLVSGTPGFPAKAFGLALLWLALGLAGAFALTAFRDRNVKSADKEQAVPGGEGRRQRKRKRKGER